MSEIINTISQTGIKELLRERLEQPLAYADRPLLIWRSYFFDGVQEQLVREVIKEHNESLPKAEWKGALVNPKRANKDRMGLCVIDTMEDYATTINNFRGIPMIVYGITPVADSSISEDFKNAEQYVFEPDFEDWASKHSARGGRQAMLVKFLRDTTDGKGVDYRWYNYYNNADISHRTGCDFPSAWLEGLSRLSTLQKIMHSAKLADVPEEDFYRFLHIRISDDLIREFREYIRNF